MIGLGISIWQAIFGGTIGAALGSDGGGAPSTVGQPTGFLLLIVRAT